MKQTTIVLFLAVSALLASAQAPRIGTKSTSSYESSIDGVIAQFVDGGAWKTTVTLINMDTAAVTYTIKFFAENGAPMTVQTSDGTASTLSGQILVGGSHVIQSLDVAPAQLTGWAMVTSSGVVGGNALFRQRVPNRDDFEASLPITTYVNSNDYTIPFDGLTTATGVAIVNPVSFSKITILLAFRDESGSRFLLDAFDVGPMQHISFDLATRYPTTLGRRGTVEMSTSGFALSVLALRFNGGAFTSILALSPI